MQITRNTKNKKIRKIRDYHGLYVQSLTFLSADVLENIRNRYRETYVLDLAYFPPTLGLAWQATFKKAKVKLDLITDIEVLLMVGKGIRSGLCRTIYQYVKANNKYM